MSAQNDLDRTLGAWFSAETAAAPPQEPLNRAIESTRTVRPRPALTARVGSGWVGDGSTPGAWGGLARLRPALLVAIVALLVVALAGGVMLVGSRLLFPPQIKVSSPVTNGWIAYTGSQGARDGRLEDTDIWLVALDREARRVVGTDTDDVDQLCPAFAPDGRRLAYGRVGGHDIDVVDGVERSAARLDAALVVADVGDDGRVTDRLTVDVGDGLPPPCPVWSTDGERIAFGEARTSPVNPESSAAGSEVWVVTLADRSITVLPDLLATDLEWSPDGSQLAIASGEQTRVPGETLQDGRVHLYEPASGATRSLDATLGAGSLTWSPDGRRIAYMTGDSRHDLRVIDVETGQEDVLATGFEAIHGIGPVWSPDGESIVYQRVCGSNPLYPTSRCGEQHEVVLVTPSDRADRTSLPREVVLPPFQVAADGSVQYLFPFRVTWSPDGEYLLYLAWNQGRGAPTENLAGLVAVPVGPDRPSVVLPLDDFVAYDGYGSDTTFVPIQTWGRAPD